jgi:hypothetical protein
MKCKDQVWAATSNGSKLIFYYRKRNKRKNLEISFFQGFKNIIEKEFGLILQPFAPLKKQCLLLLLR